MDKRTLAVWVLSLTLLAGCTTPMQKFALKNQYPQSVQHFEQTTSVAAAPLEDLYYYCISLYEIRDFGKFQTCREALDSRSRGVDSIGRTSRDAMLAELLAFHARNQIDLGTDLDDVQKDVDAALTQLSQAYSSFHNQYKIPVIHVYETAGILAALKGDRAKALAYIEKIEGVTSMAAFQLRPIKNAAIAGIYFIMKDYTNARKAIEEYVGSPFLAFATAMEVALVFPMLVHYADVGTDTSLTAWVDRGNTLSDFRIAKILFEMGEFEPARQKYEALLQKKIVQHFESVLWVILADLAAIYQREGKIEKSIEFLKRAIEIIERHRRTIATEAGRIGFVGDKQSVYAQLVRLLFMQGRIGEAFEVVERAKARAFVDLLASKRSFSGGRETPEKTAALLRELDAAEMRSAASLYRADWESAAESGRTAVIMAKDAIVKNAPGIASLVTVPPMPLAEMQKALSSGETLIEYYYHGQDLYLFAVSRDGVKGKIVPFAGLDQKVMRFRKQIVESVKSDRGAGWKPGSWTDAPAAFRPMLESGAELYRAVVEPIESAVTGDRLTIVPHGVLHYVPFGGLPAKENFLIDRYQIRVLPSASVMKHLQGGNTAPTGDLIAFGNPDLNDPKMNLRFAQEEAREIAQDRTNAKVLLRKEASKAAVRKYAQQFRIVHFATHGVFRPDKPLQSGLLLAPDGDSDGLLTAGEFYDLRLNAGLVTLSACETGLGTIGNGDDVVGLSRGLLYAGARSVVASLWVVDDRATALLMKEFYRALGSDGDRTTALRFAQRKIKDQYNPHPFFWAAFEVIGSAQ